MAIGDSENTSVGRVSRNRSKQSTVDQDNLEVLLPKIHDAIMNARTHMPADLPNDGNGSPVDTYLARAVLGVLRADSPVHFGELFRLHRDIETANRALRTAADDLHEQNQTIAALRTERDEAAACETQMRKALEHLSRYTFGIHLQAVGKCPRCGGYIGSISMPMCGECLEKEIEVALATPPSDTAQRMQALEAVVISVEHFLEVATADPGVTLGPMAARALAEARKRLDALRPSAGKDIPTA